MEKLEYIWQSIDLKGQYEKKKKEIFLADAFCPLRNFIKENVWILFCDKYLYYFMISIYIQELKCYCLFDIFDIGVLMNIHQAAGR